MNTGHNNMSRVSAGRNISHAMPISKFFSTIITLPTIGSNVSSLFYIIRNKFMETFSRYIGNNRHPYSAWTFSSNFSGYCNNRFPRCTTSADFFPDASHISFINFNVFGQQISARNYHCPSQFVKPSPGSIIAAKSENSFQTKSTGTMLLTCNKPHGQKPCTKRLACIMKQCSCGNGSLPLTFSTKKKTTFHQRRLFRFFSAIGTTKFFRPPKPDNIIKAGIVSTKPFIKLLECSRIIDAGNWVFWLFHSHILHHVVG